MKPEEINRTSYWVQRVWRCQRTGVGVQIGDFIGYLKTCSSFAHAQRIDPHEIDPDGDDPGLMLIRDCETGEVLQLGCQNGFRLETRPLVLLALQAGKSGCEY